MVSFSTYQISCRDRCAAWDYSKPFFEGDTLIFCQ
jgi:hypothetical protein